MSEPRRVAVSGKREAEEKIGVERTITVTFDLAEPVVIEKGRWINRWSTGPSSVHGSNRGYWRPLRVTQVRVYSRVGPVTEAAYWFAEAIGDVVTKDGRRGARYVHSWGRWGRDAEDPMPDWIAVLRSRAIALAAEPYVWPEVKS